MQKEIKERLAYIDIAKAVAIISVVMGHVLLWNLYTTKDAHISPLKQFIYSYHNYTFIFLSGIVSVTYIEKNDIINDVIKRFRSFIVPAIVVGIPYTLSIGDSVGNYVWDEWKWGYWYLYVLFELYLLGYPFACVRNERLVKIIYIVLIPTWIILNRHLDILSNDIRQLLCIDLLVHFFPFFLIANACKRFRWHKWMFSGQMLCISVVFWLLSPYIERVWHTILNTKSIANTYFILHMLQCIGDCLNVLLTMFKVICVISACKFVSERYDGKIMSMFLYIGMNTMYIYIFHYLHYSL